MFSEVEKSMDDIVDSFNKYIEKNHHKTSIWKTVDQIALIADRSKLVVHQTINSHSSFIQNKEGKYTTLYAYNKYSSFLVKIWNKFLSLFKR